mgnify:FL=1
MNPLEFKKFHSRVAKESREKAKLNVCPICGEEQTSFCNSHSIPQFVLNNISENGKLLQFSSVAADDFLIENRVFDTEKGTKNSCTFQFICRDCDSKVFAEYEDVYNLSRIPSNKMMAEIELKNSLLMLSKRHYEQPFYEIVENTIKNFNRGALPEIQEDDIMDYTIEFSRALRTVNNSQPAKYKLMYWKKFSYKMPIACQSQISLRETINGKKVNDVFNLSKDYHIEDLQLCVFPLEKETVIMLFYPEKYGKRYRIFRDEFLRLSEKQKLQYICYLIFAYTENFVISPNINRETLKNENLKLLAQESNGIPNMGFVPATFEDSDYRPISWKNVPNLLDKKYAIE